LLELDVYVLCLMNPDTLMSPNPPKRRPSCLLALAVNSKCVVGLEENPRFERLYVVTGRAVGAVTAL
jgi:hypothetical protein